MRRRGAAHGDGATARSQIEKATKPAFANQLDRPLYETLGLWTRDQNVLSNTQSERPKLAITQKISKRDSRLALLTKFFKGREHLVWQLVCVMRYQPSAVLMS